MAVNVFMSRSNERSFGANYATSRYITYEISISSTVTDQDLGVTIGMPL